MFKQNKLHTALVIAFGGLAMAPLALHAQQVETLSRVQVTGSRILSVNAESPAPIQVLTSEDIQASGAINLQELMLKNPVFGSPTIARTNSNFITASAGVATVDLRNLGSDRTLVLVNGRRYVAGQSGSTTVDLNMIPTDFIERVEVLTGGASASYGSDAVGGVVNIILKKSIKGWNLDASVGQSAQNDDKLKKFSASFGSTSADEKSRLMGHFSTTQQGGVYSRDRAVSALDGSSRYLTTGQHADIFINNTPTYSSFAPQGRFFYKDTANRNFTYDANGQEIPFSTNGPAGDGVGATGFNRNAFRTIAIPTDRILFAANGEHMISEAATVFFEGTYAATKTQASTEPFAVDSTGGANPIYAGGGYVPAEFLINGVKVKNFYVPNYLYTRATDRNADGLKDFNFTRRLSDVAVRSQSADRDAFRFLAGVKGDLSSVWSYDSYLSYGVTKDVQTMTGQVNAANFRNALEAIPDAAGNPVCRDPIARASGCVPVNVFGANTISPAAAQYIHAPGSLVAKITQKMAGATLTGEPFQLPAGPVGMAFGAEYRQESSSDVADALTQTGGNLGNARPVTEGSYDVKEFFGEVRLPLIKDAAFAKSIALTAAVRKGNYSTVGNATSWNAGADWAINSTVRVRATGAVSTRAPNVGELFQGAAQTFPPGLVDPCVGVTAVSTGAVSEACRKAPGVHENIATNGKFTLTLADTQGVSGYNLGNPALQAEKGKSKTLGLVLTPKLGAGLGEVAFTMDYYRIEIEDAINAPGRQYSLKQCYGGDASFCKNIQRRPTAIGANSAGALSVINDGQANTGGQFDEGVDLTASYSNRIASGMFTSKLSYTRLLQAWMKATPDADIDYSTGELRAARNRWSLNLGYEQGNWAIKTSTTYIGESYLDDQFMDGNEIPKEFGRIDPKTYTDAQLTYKSGRAQYYFGINNLFDTKAPLIPSGIPGNTTGVETNGGTYDPIGRRYYIGLRYAL